MALEDNKLEAAGRMFERVPASCRRDDGQAAAGIKIVDRLKDGTLTNDKLRKQLDKRNAKVDQVKMVDGKPQWVKVDLAKIAQEEKVPACGRQEPEGPCASAPENLLKEAPRSPGGRGAKGHPRRR